MNYLKKHIESLLSEITALNANLNVLESFILASSKQLTANSPISAFTLYSMMTTYRDLSQIGGGSNLFDTGCRYELSTANLQSETKRLLSYISCLTISQTFEVFESYLKNILSELIFKNPELITTLKLTVDFEDFNTIRNSLFQIQGKNNKGLIKVLRRVSPFFKSFESNNIWKLNMSEWFDLIATVRHIVIHQRQNVDETFINYVKTKGLNSIFSKHFTIENKQLVLTPYQANAIINHLFEYAHLIYKGMSNDFKLEIDILFSIGN